MAVLAAPEISTSAGLDYPAALATPAAPVIAVSPFSWIPAPNVIGGEGQQVPSTTTGYPF